MFASPSPLILLSFPKSGNTFFRLVIVNYDRLSNGMQPIQDFQQLNNEAPEIGGKLYYRSSLTNSAKFWKTHHSIYSHFFRGVFIHRSFLDVVSSYASYSRERQARTLSEDEIIRSIESFICYIQAKNLFFVDYSRLISDPFAVFCCVFRCFGIDYESELLQSAILSSSKEAVKAFEQEGSDRRDFIASYEPASLTDEQVERLGQFDRQVDAELRWLNGEAKG